MTRLAAFLLTTALLLIPAAASAHTGSLTVGGSCDTGIRLTRHLDDNVADTSTWTLTVRGQLRDSGTGPGPQDETYGVGTTSGSATLVITFGQEHNAYSVTWDALTGCTPPPHVYAPAAEILQPCGDPLFRVRLDNRLSDRSVPFVIRYHAYRGSWVRATFRVAGHARTITPHFHATGSTVITVTARGHVLDRERIAAPGTYDWPCR